MSGTCKHSPYEHSYDQHLIPQQHCFANLSLIFYKQYVLYIVVTVTFPLFTGMKSFTAHIHNIFYVSVEFSHSHHFETNQSVSMKEIAATMVTEIHDRLDEFLAVYDWISFVFSFFFLTLLFK